MAGQPSVDAFIASLNTAHSSELAIRTARRFAGYPFRLTVGDGGSHDGSLDMLRRLERLGWLELQVDPRGPGHAEWLDRWTAAAGGDYACFIDSDVEFLRPNWLRELVDAAALNGADLVYAETLDGSRRYTVPRSGEAVELAPRPAPWLFLVRPESARRVPASFAEQAVDGGNHGRRRVYDVGGIFYLRARELGLRAHVMEPGFRRRYRHFGGASWRRDDRRPSPFDLSSDELIRRRLAAARAADAGRHFTARSITAYAEGRRRVARAAELGVKAARPTAWQARRERARNAIPFEADQREATEASASS